MADYGSVILTKGHDLDFKETFELWREMFKQVEQVSAIHKLKKEDYLLEHKEEKLQLRDYNLLGDHDVHNVTVIKWTLRERTKGDRNISADEIEKSKPKDFSSNLSPNGVPCTLGKSPSNQEIYTQALLKFLLRKHYKGKIIIPKDDLEKHASGTLTTEFNYNALNSITIATEKSVYHTDEFKK